MVTNDTNLLLFYIIVMLFGIGVFLMALPTIIDLKRKEKSRVTRS